MSLVLNPQAKAMVHSTGFLGTYYRPTAVQKIFPGKSYLIYVYPLAGRPKLPVNSFHMKCRGTLQLAHPSDFSPTRRKFLYDH